MVATEAGSSSESGEIAMSHGKHKMAKFDGDKSLRTFSTSSTPSLSFSRTPFAFGSLSKLHLANIEEEGTYGEWLSNLSLDSGTDTDVLNVDAGSQEREKEVQLFITQLPLEFLRTRM